MTDDDSRQKVNILVVDDRPDKLIALEAVLSELDENILKATSGADALRLLLRHDVAVILLDVNMPLMDGFETAALIRQRKNFEHTPIIFITGINVNDNHVSKGYALGAVDYIFSPVVPEILKTKVAVFIELYRSREQVRAQGQLLLEAAERKAAGLETRLQDLLNRLNLGIFRCTASGAVLEANPAFFRILGISDLKSVPPLIIEQISRLGKRDDSPASNENSGVDIEIPVASGGSRWFLVSAALTTSATGESVIEGLLEDITTRKEAEEALKESDRRKDRFLAILSHELRNPLAAMQSAIQVSEKIPAGSHDTWTRDILRRQVKHLGRLTDDLLDIARINQDKIELQRDAVDLSGIIARAIDVVRPSIDQQRHIFEQTLGPRLFVSGDATRLEQIVVNLLQNAIKYTGQGGRIRVKAERLGTDVQISVVDSGVGIAPDMLPKVFDPFTQSDKSLDRSQGGLGIGLTLVKRLVELHDGKVTAWSEGPGRGSEFLVNLPALQDDPAMIEEAKTPAARAGSGKVLMVDDNRDSAMLTAELLRLSGYSVIIAHDGHTALELADREKPPVILLDIGLPGMDGCEVARRLKQNPEFQNTLFVAISGYGQEKDIARSHAAGFDYHLVKPVDFDVLSEILEKTPPDIRHDA
ncbi:MAG: response regulator [Bdellovibrionota bacterium]